MKRIHNLLILALFTIATALILSGCGSGNQVDRSELQLVCSYELVAAKVNFQTQVHGDISGAYLLGFGGMYGNIETTATKVYDYWYKREDGGIIPDTIDMSLYDYPETVTIVIYEDDSTTPKVEIWRNYYAQRYGDGEDGYSEIDPPTVTEFRFTIPSGSFVNTYDLQGLAEDSQ